MLSLSFAAGQVRPQCGSLSGPSTTWSDSNGSWGAAGNWTSGTPNASTNACILDGTSTVTLDTNGNAKGLQIASGNVLNVINAESLSLSGASFNYGAIYDASSPNGSTITNSGTLNNAGALFLNEGSILYNSGTIINTAVEGQVRFAFYIDSAGFINTGAFYNYGTASNEGGITNNSGAFIINYGTFSSFSSGEITNSGTFLNTSGGTVNTGANGGRIINYGTFSNAGTLTTQAGFDNYGALSNSGTFNNTAGTSGGTLNNYGRLLNTSGATLFNDSLSTLTNTGTIINSGAINNSGTINSSGTFINSGAVTISSSGLFTTSTNYIQTGGNTLVNGTLSATGSAIVNIQGGTLGGTGTINGNVEMAGTMMPGAPGAPGALTIFGNYEQTGNGTFDELMGPLSHSFLDVSGNVTLDTGALLDITLLNGFDPLNQTFSIMDFASRNGQFSNGFSFWDDGYLWDITYRQHEVDVTAVQAPEPSSLLLLLISLAALGLYTHRKMGKTQRLA